MSASTRNTLQTTRGTTGLPDALVAAGTGGIAQSTSVSFSTVVEPHTPADSHSRTLLSTYLSGATRESAVYDSTGGARHAGVEKYLGIVGTGAGPRNLGAPY